MARKALAGMVFVKEAAEISGYCPQYLKRLARAKRIPGAVQRGRAWCFDPAALRIWAAAWTPGKDKVAQNTETKNALEL